MERKVKKSTRVESFASCIIVGLTLFFLDTASLSSAAAIAEPPKRTLECHNSTLTKLYMKEHSLEQFQIEESANNGLPLEHWETGGNSTIVDGKAVRLFQSGSLWNSVPVDTEDWEVQLKVEFHGKEEEKDENPTEQPGHEFWYTRFIMPPSGSKSRSEGLLILIEKTRHGIEGNVPLSSESTTNTSTNSTIPNVATKDKSEQSYIEYDWQLSGCSAPLLNSPFANQTWLKIRYEKYHLSVATKHGEEDSESEEWVTCFMEKGQEELYLPISYYYGFSSASESEDNDNYLDIMQVKFYELSPSNSPVCLDEVTTTQSPSSSSNRSAESRIPISKTTLVREEEDDEEAQSGEGGTRRKLVDMVFPVKVLWVPLLFFCHCIILCNGNARVLR